MEEREFAVIEEDITLRNIEKDDIEEIVKMAELAFGNPLIAFDPKHYESHIKIFPDGQVCIDYDGVLVGSCSSIIVNFDDYGEEHSMSEISANGYITNHNPKGKNLYGIDVVVHPEYRQLRLGRRLYEARRNIAERHNLESIIIGGRIPNYHKYANQLTPLEYAKKVERGELYDPVMTFQLRNGFKLRGILQNYLPNDHESLEHATLMEWHNPKYQPETNF